MSLFNHSLQSHLNLTNLTKDINPVYYNTNLHIAKNK